MLLFWQVRAKMWLIHVCETHWSRSTNCTPLSVIERQPRLDAQCADGGFLHRGKRRAAPLLRSHRHVFHRLPMALLQEGLLIDPVMPREARDRSLRSL